jgi:hypothetical protein
MDPCSACSCQYINSGPVYTDCVRYARLRDHCRVAKVDNEVCTELMSFLRTKVLVGDSGGTKMSPSASMDRLWHRLLLDTRFMDDTVYPSLGGRPHHELDAADNDCSKMMRRLHAMYLMRQHGFVPNIKVWAEPNTVMQDIILENEAYVCLPTPEGMIKALRRMRQDDNEDRLVLDFKPPAARERFPGVIFSVPPLKPGDLFVKTMNDNVIGVDFSSLNTVVDLKQAIAAVLPGWKPEDLRLIFAGRQLEDDWRLIDYNLRPGSTVHMVMRLRGC